LLVATCVHAVALSAQTQFPTPPFTLPGATWNGGVHHYTALPEIICPEEAQPSMEITNDADAEFVSGSAVHLKDGFHAGGFIGTGQFHAHIGEGFGDPTALVLISPGPDTSISDGTVHVHQWEKLELGLQLPTMYQAAIDSFFTHYYSNGPDAAATPGMVDPIHDLNPYADDSLQLVMTLTKPSGQQTLKWGFFMREAVWENQVSQVALLIQDTIGSLAPYSTRFRFAPDTIGDWSFSISVKAPNTLTSTGQPLPEVSYPVYSFVCDPPLPDNKGRLRVNDANHRTLKFETGEPFFGMGPNLADQDGGPQQDSVPAGVNGESWFLMRHNTLMETMEQLHEVGGNFTRIFLMRHIFQVEHENLGVYDRYRADNPCGGGVQRGNCQFQCYAFDKVLDQARANNIYIQMCVDAFSFPSIGRQKDDWGHSPYWRHFVQPFPGVVGNPRDIKRYFYTPDSTGQPLLDSGAFYYWKRKYKYMMSRWGYSVNIAAIEPFNEIDQMLSYFERTVEPNANCGPNNGLWLADPDLPATLDTWITDLTDFVRGEVDVDQPVTSPLGEDKLFIQGFAWNEPLRSDRETFYRPFNNPKLDLLDTHVYGFHDPGDADRPDAFLEWVARSGDEFHRDFPTNGGAKKPFNHGESGYLTQIHIPGYAKDLEKCLHNYDVSFHNEIWSGAFSGSFATGLSWHWARIFWWPNSEGARRPPPDQNNPYFFSSEQQFSNVLGDVNKIYVNGDSIGVRNRRIHHHFKSLADLLAHPSWTGLGFFNGDYTANRVFDTSDTYVNEAYYLKSLDSTTAIGWVHNRNAWVMNNYYLNSNLQNFLGCTPPDSTTITLTGFARNTPLFITWFPTHLNSTVHPPHDTLITTTGDLRLDLYGYLGGAVNNYLDTLRSDYAFIITPAYFEKRIQQRPVVELAPLPDWDFELYPNPAREILYLRFMDDTPKRVSVFDMAGRQVVLQANITETSHYLETGNLAMGSYWVQVSDGSHRKVKKLIIQ